jgi:hypothetical protein
MASFARWPARLAPPALPDHNLVRYRAQSILTDAGSPGPLLPYEQARDVVAWHESRLQRQQSDTFAGKVRRLFRPFHSKGITP